MNVVSITEAARRLSCSRGHVYNLIAAGELRVVNIGIGGRPKSRLYPEDIDAYLERKTRVAS